MFENNKLRGRIVEKYGTLKAFSKIVNCSLSFLSLYFHGKKKLDQPTMAKWIEALEIEPEEVYDYFFVEKVHE